LKPEAIVVIDYKDFKGDKISSYMFTHT